MNPDKIKRAHAMLRHLITYRSFYEILQVKSLNVTELFIESRKNNYAEVCNIINKGARLGLLKKKNRGAKMTYSLTEQMINKINKFSNEIV